MTIRYMHWTPLAAFCFERKFKCENCSEAYFCSRRPFNNEYGMKPLKFAALQTFANIGTDGLENALNMIGKRF